MCGVPVILLRKMWIERGKKEREFSLHGGDGIHTLPYPQWRRREF